MAIFPRPVSPKAAIADLRNYLRHSSSREQRLGALFAIIATAIIVFEFFIDSHINMAPEPTLIYVKQWDSKRTDAQIIADQKKDQAAREAGMKERQRQFQRLGKQLGIE
ncbi:MAG: hypothetical protein ABIQ32_05985 [Sphingomicrobium sp.]